MIKVRLHRASENMRRVLILFYVKLEDIGGFIHING